jgi:hypothetical protein
LNHRTIGPKLLAALMGMVGLATAMTVGANAKVRLARDTGAVLWQHLVEDVYGEIEVWRDLIVVSRKAISTLRCDDETIVSHIPIPPVYDHAVLGDHLLYTSKTDREGHTKRTADGLPAKWSCRWGPLQCLA